MKGKGNAIDSPMTGFPAVKGYESAPGKYSEHPNLGPAGVSGGMPLKITDEAIKTPEIQPTDNPGMVIPTAKKSS